jgi:hypothetical protein
VIALGTRERGWSRSAAAPAPAIVIAPGAGPAPAIVIAFGGLEPGGDRTRRRTVISDGGRASAGDLGRRIRRCRSNSAALSPGDRAPQSRRYRRRRWYSAASSPVIALGGPESDADRAGEVGSKTGGGDRARHRELR